jgi:hypothetical protein
MPESPAPPKQPVATRREKFRAYMKNFNPIAPARDAIDSGLVLEDLHNSLSRSLAARADLEPGSQQLLVGGIGSGKTTELLLAEKWLGKQASTLPLFIDITAETDLSGLNTGALLAAFGLHLGRRFYGTLEAESSAEDPSEVGNACRRIKEFAFGRAESAVEKVLREAREASAQLKGYVPGRLRPPIPALQRQFQDIAEPLGMLVGAFREYSWEVVVILDGLDRLITLDKFWAVVEPDLRALRELRVSVLAAAPISILYESGKSISEHFDRVHHLAALTAEPGKARELKAVLAQRGGAEMLGPLEAARICMASGGVLRDLVTVARDAGEEAYVSGSDRIRIQDVGRAIQQLGTAYLRGLGPGQVQALLNLNKTGSFDLGSPINMELLVTRRVLEYSPTDFRVHPALLPLITKPEARIA